MASEQTTNFSAGYFWSILFMLSVPAMILGGFSTAIYVSYRRWKRGGSGTQADPESR